MLIIAMIAAVMIYGNFALRNLPIDVFPDLNRPVVTVLTEAEGMAPEDVEALVTYPIETAMGGMPGVMQVRSTSSVGLSLVYIDFDWGTDIYRNRQLVAERLAMIERELPETVKTLIGPITSIMGDVQLVGVSATNPDVTPLEVRTWADWVLKKQILAVPGVSQVTVIGGLEKQYHIDLNAQKISYYNFSFEDLEHAFDHISNNSSGGYYYSGDTASLVRNIGMVESIADIENSLVGFHQGVPILIKDIASVRIAGPPVRFGDASVNEAPAVLLTVRKQPEVSTLALTERIANCLKVAEKNAPEGIKIHKHLFRQATFIEIAIKNVKEVLRDGALVTAFVLFLFLLNLRTTFISLTAIPLSLLLTFIVFYLFGLSVNTMTLGGLAIAIGELVDDAIVDVENVFRRLRENKQSPSPSSPLKVVFEASKEIRSSIVFGTLIVIFVFFPLFYLTGLEGRFFVPLGIAYIVSLICSLFVSLTVTPVLCSFLLPNASATEKEEGWLVRKLKDWDRICLNHCLQHPKRVLGVAGVLLLTAFLALPFMGTRFLPPFQETTAMVTLSAPPGTSLEASNRLGKQAEKLIRSIPEVKTVSRKTGRAREDEHAHGVNVSEIDIDFNQSGRNQFEVLEDIRKKVASLKDVNINIGQPLSHRIDHMMSGVPAEVVVKIFGPSLKMLRRKAAEIKDAIAGIEGLVDLQVEAQTLIPETKVYLLREEAAKHGVMVGEVTAGLETALHGKVVGEVVEDQQMIDIYTRFDDLVFSGLESLRGVPVRVKPDGTPVLLEEVAEIYNTKGPNAINKENQMRRIVVQANVSKRDTGGVIQEIQKQISEKISLPEGYSVEFDGQFKAQQEATQHILLLGCGSILGIFTILWWHFGSAWLSAQVVLTIPFGMIGAMWALMLGDRTLSIASLVGFITLCGICSRNTILMLSHYIYLVKNEGEKFTKEMVIRGSLERLIPVLMTSSTAMVALIPLALAAGETGKEILHPLAVVIIGGLATSTILDILVTPSVFYHYGRKWTEKALKKSEPIEWN